MEDLKIIPVLTRKDRKEFVEYPLRLYKDNPYFVPPFYADEMSLFTPKNIYFKTCESTFFLAKRGAETVGRIQGILQKQYNEIRGLKQVRFTRFDCEDNVETAKALFDAVEAWAREKGMTEVVGPLGYSDLEREGLLIEGFDYLSTFEEQYNYAYYPALVERCGYEKDVDWLEHRLFKCKEVSDRMKSILDHTMKKCNLHFGDKSLGKKKFIKKYKEGIFRCIDECYKDLYGTVPFTPEMQKQIVDQFTLFIDPKYIEVACDEKDEVVAFGLCMPGLGEALQKSGGRLTPACLIRLLKALKKPRSVDLGLVGIMPKYRNGGLSVFMITVMQDMFKDPNIEYLETNLNLEENTAIRSMWKRFEHIQHKRRRSYIKKL
ncbi:MAG: N-acetyltransferase [Clostridia bacterium]|nr:N-acetyltransferase [Clostridia bacterium]